MATSTFYKFNQFVEDLGKTLHNLATGGDQLYVLLTNAAPQAADTVVDEGSSPCQLKPSNVAEIAAGNGYTKLGAQITGQQFIQTSGTAKLYGVKVSWTCVTAPMATFRYAVIYNHSKGTANTRPVIGWYDYGVGGVSLGVGETFTLGNSNDGTDWTATYPILTVT